MLTNTEIMNDDLMKLLVCKSYYLLFCFRESMNGDSDDEISQLRAAALSTRPSNVRL